MSEEEKQEQVAPICAFRKIKRKTPTRARAGEAGSGGEDEETAVVVRKKEEKKLNSFSTKRHRDGPRDPQEPVYESTKELQNARGNDSLITSTIDTETPRDQDARAVWERAKEAEAEGTETKSGKRAYKGKGAYSTGLERAADYTGGGMAPKGPMRSSSSIRITCRFDYQPDVCKDYKETGFCGYGDSCKFMHDRGDYKSGWQLEREWDDEQRKKRQKLEGLNADMEEEGQGDSDKEDDVPFACFICREHFTLAARPIVTK
eukprot:c16184_g1_i1.p1 GENE.c16184_g1_i1~~c16184_g1_i1.p1  ORF type:complete len:270 (+),score=50.14 c16184_g1_i1:29-811(+)